jgi:hypothetical protein
MLVKDRHDRHGCHTNEKDLQNKAFDCDDGVTIIDDETEGPSQQNPANSEGVTTVTAVTIKCSLFLKGDTPGTYATLAPARWSPHRVYYRYTRPLRTMQRV